MLEAPNQAIWVGELAVVAQSHPASCESTHKVETFFGGILWHPGKRPAASGFLRQKGRIGAAAPAK